MLTLNDRNILACWMPIDGREFTRYFSGFPITSLDQEVICYHKKNFHVRNWKDVGSGMEVFLCREKLEDLNLGKLNETYSDWDFYMFAFAPFLEMCRQHGQLMIRDNVIHGMQVHVPLTGELMGKEDIYTKIVHAFWAKGYVIVQTIMQTKDFPLIQWSITDPTLLAYLVKNIENSQTTDIVPTIGSADRREQILQDLVNRSEQNEHKTDLLDEYDVMPIRCDS